MAITQYGDISPGDAPRVLRTLISAINRMSVRTTNTLANAAGQTLTAAQVIGSTLVRSGAAAVTDTTPTAAQLVAASNGAQVGDVGHLSIQNNNSGTLTIAAGSGVTLAGTTTVAAANTRDYQVEFTNVTAGAEAVTLRGIRTAAV